MPALVALVTLAGRRWGPRVAGWLAGFPVVAGPTLWFIWIDHGAAFAAEASAAALRAVPGNVAFGLAYAWTAQRFAWPLAAGAAMLLFAVCGGLAMAVRLPVPVAAGLAFLLLAIVPRLYPRVHHALRAAATSRWELPVRCLCAGALVAGVTWSAERLGSGWSGILAVFPVMGLVLGVFSHRAWGSAGVARLFAGMTAGLYAFAAFCACLAWLLARVPGRIAFPVAIGVALAVQFAAYRRRPEPSTPDRVPPGPAA